MKILFDTTPLDTGHQHRGIGTYTRNLLEALSSMPEVTIISSSATSREKRAADIIHYPFFDLFFSTLPIPFSQRVVVTIHDVIPLIFSKQYPVGIKGKVTRLWQQWKLQQVRAVITDSECSKHDIHKYLNVPNSKINSIPLASNQQITNQPLQKVNKVLSKYSIPPSYILYVGDINYNKNIPQLIKSLKFLPENIHLVCVGKNFVPHDIPEWNWIETQLAMSQVEDRVHFISTLSHQATQELSALYSGAVAYIQPSLYEGFGLPVLEAMQCKTPVVASNRSSLPELVGEYGYLVQPEAESLAKGILDILSLSSTQRQQLIKRAYQHSQKYSWSRVAKETISVYQAVLNGK